MKFMLHKGSGVLRGRSLRGFGTDRQNQSECGAFAHLAFHLHSSVHTLNRMLHDGETESGPAHFARASLIHAIETLEDARQVFGRNTDARVGDGDKDMVLTFVSRLDAHDAVRTIEL